MSVTEREDRKKEAPRWAADEPTAMWDGGALEEQGLEASPRPKPTAPQRAPSGGLSWPLTIGIALAVAVVVYFAVRALRG